jgi:hypothetical protein
MTSVAVQLCVFSLGWLSLHALRPYARHLTPVLSCVALALALLLLAVVSARQGISVDPDAQMASWLGD